MPAMGHAQAQLRVTLDACLHRDRRLIVGMVVIVAQLVAELIAVRVTVAAHITAAIAIDFATAMVDLKPGEELDNLWTWHKRVTSRPDFVS